MVVRQSDIRSSLGVIEQSLEKTQTNAEQASMPSADINASLEGRHDSILSQAEVSLGVEVTNRLREGLTRYPQLSPSMLAEVVLVLEKSSQPLEAIKPSGIGLGDLIKRVESGVTFDASSQQRYAQLVHSDFLEALNTPDASEAQKTNQSATNDNPSMPEIGTPVSDKQVPPLDTNTNSTPISIESGTPTTVEPTPPTVSEIDKSGKLTQEQITELAKKQTVQVGEGSGVVVGQDDKYYYVVTNNHTIPEGTTQGGAVEGYTVDGKKLSATLVRRDNDDDLSLVRVAKQPGLALEVADIAEAPPLQKNDPVYTVGYPYFYDEQTSKQQWQNFTVNKAEIEKVGTTELSTDKDQSQSGYSIFVQPPGVEANSELGNSSVIPGMSGGPLYNEQGQVVGINGAGTRANLIPTLIPEIYDSQGKLVPAENLPSASMSIPSAKVREFVGGKVEPLW